MYKTLKSVIAAFGAALLVGCGGGGGGGSDTPTVNAAALSTSNQTVAAQDVASTAFAVIGTTQTVIGAVSTNESAIYREAFSQLDRLPDYMRDAVLNRTAIGAVVSQSYYCFYAGTYSVSVTDSDNSNTVSTGDSISLTFNSCREREGTFGGNLSLRVDSLSGTYGASAYSAGATMTFGSLSISGSNYSASILGSVTVSGAKTGTNAYTQSIDTTSLSASATYGGVTRTRALTNFNATETRVPNGTYTYLSSNTINGTLTSSGFTGTQSVSFSTPTTFVRRGTDAYPYTGRLLITGANNSALRLTAVSNLQVQQDLDANGDGAYEGTSTVNWNTLL